MHLTRLSIALFFCLATMPSCNAKRLAAFSVTRIVSVEATSIDASGFVIKVRCEVKNPNPLGATIKNLKVRALLDGPSAGHSIGDGSLAGPIEVKPNSRFSLTLPLRVRYRDLPADLPQRLSRGVIELRSEVLLFVKSRWGEHPLRLTVRSKTEIARALRVAIKGSFAGSALRIHSVKLGGLRLRKVWLRLGIQATNLFRFPLRIRRAVAKLSINGSYFGYGRLDQALALPPGHSVEAKIDVVATHGAVGRAISAMMGSGPKFEVKGTVWIDPIGGISTIPFSLTADSSVFGSQRFVQEPDPTSRGQSLLPKSK